MSEQETVALSAQAKRFFTEKINWDTSERQALKERATGWKWFSIAGWGIAVTAIAAVIPLTALHDFVPISIVVDKFTGEYEVRVGKERFDMGDKKNEQRMVADIGRFVKAREGFTRAESESNYRIVYYSLAEDLRGAWDNEYLPQLNPRSLLATLSVRDQIKIVNPTIAYLPEGPDPKYKVAQLRFDKERRYAGKPATRQPYLATVTFYYDTANVPKTVEGLIANAFGFTVANYRADEQGPEREIRDTQQQVAR
jgi:type IV secretory pathway component VirB8